MHRQHRAAGRDETARRVFGVHPRLDGVPVQDDVRLRDGKVLARRDADLPLDQVEAGDQLGDRVLDLQPGVHLHEEELVRVVRRQDELDGARADVTDRARGFDRRRAHLRARGLVEQHRRRFLDDLLVPPLQAALALAEVDDVAVGVGQHLDLDVPRCGDEPFHQQRVVAEGTLGLAPRRLDRGVQFGLFVDQPHALAATTGGRLEQQRIADLRRGGGEPAGRDVHIGRTGHHRDAGLRHGRLGADLVAHGVDRGDRRADEHQPGGLAGPRELGVLRQEAVTRVHRLRARGHRGVHDGRNREVALRSFGGSDPDGGVRLPDVPRVGVGVAVDGDRADAEVTQRANDPHRDLAAVRDQH